MVQVRVVTPAPTYVHLPQLVGRVAVSARLIVPTATLAGVRLVSVGAGGGAVTVRDTALDKPPPGVGLKTVMLCVPTLATSVAGRVVVNCVADPTVVTRSSPSNRTR